MPFLNLLTNIQQRAGRVNIRLGGGIVDFASLVDDLGSDQTEAVLFGTANTVSFNATNTLLFLPSYSSLFFTNNLKLGFWRPVLFSLGFLLRFSAATGVYPWAVVHAIQCVRVAKRSLVYGHVVISSFLFATPCDIRRLLGIPLNETHRFRTRVAEEALTILGDNLLGLQVGDQPDQYAIAGMRPYVRLPALIVNTAAAERTPAELWPC